MATETIEQAKEIRLLVHGNTDSVRVTISAMEFELSNKSGQCHCGHR
jgi:hypothetical protein